jgi:16S rRNA A1518/A1519 N6-dimethyltransferase RsmA/KsgA/DIM1 with predicted DNA glycosylase/AP lyase activity
MYLVVQRQFARKLVPGNDHFTSQLAAQIGPWFTARIRKPLRRTDFTPPPGVDTVLLEIKPREEQLLPSEAAVKYREFIERSFSEQKYFTRLDRARVNISPEKTPSQLSQDEWLRLFATLNVR